MKKEFDFLVFAGRFAPFTLAHQFVVREALKHADKVIILVGSSFQAREPRVPWTFDERADMIRLSLSDEELRRIEVLPIKDYANDQNWVKRVKELVNVFADHRKTVGLIGHSKDHSSFYLKLFPDWKPVNVPNFQSIDATKVREAFFQIREDEVPFVTIEVADYLMRWENGEFFEDALNDHMSVVEYQRKYGKGPFTTVDFMAMWNNRVLMIQRKKAPGKGLWALPGGFVEYGERLCYAAIRELEEETGLIIEPTLVDNISENSFVVDLPHRDPRAHIITHVHPCDLSKIEGFEGYIPPSVTGMDDAADAQWFEQSEITRMNTFAGHFHIVNRLLGMEI